MAMWWKLLLINKDISFVRKISGNFSSLPLSFTNTATFPCPQFPHTHPFIAPIRFVHKQPHTQSKALCQEAGPSLTCVLGSPVFQVAKVCAGQGKKLIGLLMGARFGSEFLASCFLSFHGSHRRTWSLLLLTTTAKARSLSSCEAVVPLVSRPSPPSLTVGSSCAVASALLSESALLGFPQGAWVGVVRGFQSYKFTLFRVTIWKIISSAASEISEKLILGIPWSLDPQQGASFHSFKKRPGLWNHNPECHHRLCLQHLSSDRFQCLRQVSNVGS